MVSVFGSVYNESAFVHRPEKTVTDYLEQAGGPKKEADRRNMFLLRADGSVVPNKGGWFGGGQLASLKLRCRGIRSWCRRICTGRR
jgi:polysaccharide biosynthesis/export protein